MADKDEIAESILKITGFLPLIDRLMHKASKQIDGEYGWVDDDELEGVCYSHMPLINEGEVSRFLCAKSSALRLAG